MAVQDFQFATAQVSQVTLLTVLCWTDGSIGMAGGLP
jgi:hypothetical protein